MTSQVSPETPQEKAGDEGPAKPRGWWRPVVLLAAVILIMVLAWQFEVGEKLEKLEKWIKSLGPWGPVAFILIYVAATVAALPGLALSLIAGGIFGPFWGVAIVSVASTAGAGASFLIGRYFARDVVSRWLRKSEKFGKLEEMTRRHGASIVAITRLVPVFPYNLLNYGFSLTAVPFRTYLFWSWLCMLPGTVLYVALGGALTTLIKEGKVSWALVVVVVVVFVGLAIVGRYARRKLKGGDESPEEPPAPE